MVAIGLHYILLSSSRSPFTSKSKFPPVVIMMHHTIKSDRESALIHSSIIDTQTGDLRPELT